MLESKDGVDAGYAEERNEANETHHGAPDHTTITGEFQNIHREH
jgi:hypothetical protein